MLGYASPARPGAAETASWPPQPPGRTRSPPARSARPPASYRIEFLAGHRTPHRRPERSFGHSLTGHLGFKIADQIRRLHALLQPPVDHAV